MAMRLPKLIMSHIEQGNWHEIHKFYIIEITSEKSDSYYDIEFQFDAYFLDFRYREITRIPGNLRIEEARSRAFEYIQEKILFHMDETLKQMYAIQKRERVDYETVTDPISLPLTRLQHES